MPVTVVTAAAPTTGTLPVSQSFTSSALGTQVPKLVIVEATRATSVGPVSTGGMFAMGAWDGTNVHSCVAGSGDAQAVGALHNASHRDSTTKIIQILTVGSTAIDGEADPVSLDAGGFTMSWTDLCATGIQLKVTMVWGDDWEAFVGSYVGSTSNNGVVSPAVPFPARGLIFFGVRDTAGSGAGADGIFNLGFAALNEDGTVQGQAGHPYFEANTPAINTACGSGVRNDSAVQRIIVDGVTEALTEECRHEVTAGGATSFDVTTRVAGGFALTSHFIALRNGSKRTWVGVPTLGMTTTGDKTVTPGFPPGVIWGIPNVLDTINAYASSGLCANFGLAVSCPDGTIKGCTMSSEDGVATSDTYCATSSNFAGLGVTGGADWVATVTARGATTFTFNVSNAASLDVLTPFLVFEEPKDPGWWSALRRWRRQLARM